jgi:hypothetical protein
MQLDMNQQHLPDDEATSDYGDSIGVSEFTSIHSARLIHAYEHGR